MRIVCIAIVSFCVILASAKPAPAKEWRGITPLKSTRADVERLLGPASEKHEHSDLYRLKDEVVNIEYAAFPCGHKAPPGWPEAPRGWDAPKGTVVAISVRPRNQTILGSLDIDLSGFKKWRGAADMPQHYVYSNGEEGLNIEVFEHEDPKSAVVAALIYFPTSAEEKTYRCKE